MIHVTIDEAAARLPELLDCAVQGDVIEIERPDGTAVQLNAIQHPIEGAEEFSYEALAGIDDRELNHFLC